MSLRSILLLLFSCLSPLSLCAASAGTGLWGQYYQDAALSQFAGAELDSQVDFTWPSGVTPAVAGMNDSTFSVRWSGQIEALCADNYTFSTVSDDGVRLYLNGSLVIDNWTSHSATVDAAPPMFLAAGATVSVVMEVFDNYGDARAALQWQAPGCVASAQVIPSAQLYPDNLSTPTPTSVPTALPVWACPVPDALSSGLSGIWTTHSLNPIVPDLASVSGGALNISADGAGVLQGPMFGEASTGDSAYFLSQPVWGDFDVRLRVLAVPGTPAGQAGLMLRESVDESARQVFIGASNAGFFQESHRLNAGAGNSGSSAGTYSNGTPQWVRLVRSGNTVQSYYSPDGATWTPVGPATTFASLSSDLLLGIAASSDLAGVTGTARVANFQVASASCTTATPTLTPTSTASPSSTVTPSITPSPTITQSFTQSPTFTQSPSVTPSPTITLTFTVSPTFTASPSISPSPTISPTFTPLPGPPLSHLWVYPNPFADRLWIAFTLGADASVEMVAYNVAGEEVYRHTDPYSQGTHQRPWDGVNSGGARLASGIYLIRLKADGTAGWLSDWVTVACVR